LLDVPLSGRAEARRLTSFAGASDEGYPSWSPDGRFIYFRSVRSGSPQIWKVPAEGGSPVRITAGGGVQAIPSPDGSFLYYIRGAAELGLWRVHAAEGTEEPVQALAAVRMGYWDVCRDGVVFIDSDRAGSVGAQPVKLFRFDSGTTVDLFHMENPAMLFPGFSAALDLTAIYWNQREHLESDLKWIPQFRP
jgi:hypothetical protein